MKIGAIVFSRMNSSRLPGKALLKLSDGTVLSEIIERVKKIDYLDHFCIATSNNESDDPILHEGRRIGVDVFRGSLENVLDRGIKASDFFGYTDFLRICGDRPLLDPMYYQELILAHKKLKNDLTTNIFPRTVPPGLSGEIIKIGALKGFESKVKDKRDKENLTQYFYKNPKIFKIHNVNQNNKSIPINYNLTLDTINDYKKIIWIYENLKSEDKYNTKKIMGLNIKWEKTNGNTWNT